MNYCYTGSLNYLYHVGSDSKINVTGEYRNYNAVTKIKIDIKPGKTDPRLITTISLPINFMQCILYHN